MQTTLLGLAIALILALVAALVGPLLIDWGGYRTVFEAEASHLVGLDVRVTGPIEARLLPSPQLTLHGIEIGHGAHEIKARSLGIELALGPLMRGQWHATDLHLVGPQVRLDLDAAGHVQAPSLAVKFNPDALSVERLNIQDGKLTLTDAAGGHSVTLDKFWFNGHAGSLLGPFDGEGAVTVHGDLYPFRLATGRYDDGKLKLHINVDPVNYPLSAQAAGELTLAGGKPDFDGRLSLTRPVVIASRKTGRLKQPWHVSGKIKVTAVRALMQDFEFQYGSEDKGIKLTGDADFKYGHAPSFDGVVSGGQIDLDRTLAESDGGQAAPASAVRELAELAGRVFRPAIPIRIGIGLDQVTLGGEPIENVQGDISSSTHGWNLDRFEFRAPGFSQVRLSGALTVNRAGVAFAGPAEIKTNYPKVLAAWLEGHKPSAKSEIAPLSLRGDLTLAGDKIAVERLNAEFEHETITGHFAYAFAAGKRPARLDAALHAPDLDLDQALAFGKAMLIGSHMQRPRDMTISADIGHATIGGFQARNASARLKVDADGIEIDRLSVADLGGAAFSASGRIVITPPSPQGSIRVDLDAPDMRPVMALLARLVPATARELDRSASAMAPAKLHATLTVAGAAPAAQAKLAVEGSLGKVRVAFNGEISGDLKSFEAGDMQMTGKFSAYDGQALLAILGLDKRVLAGAGPGSLTLKADGPVRGTWQVNGKLAAADLGAQARGTASPLADEPSADLHVVVARADLTPIPGIGNRALPVTYSGRVALAGDDVSLNDIDATIAGVAVRGKLGLTLAKPHRLQGEIEADRIDGDGLIAAAIGMPPSPPEKGAAWRWSSDPFGAGVFGDYEGAIKIRAQQFNLLPRLTARDFNATLRLGKSKLALDDMSGDAAGGRFSGRLSLSTNDDGVNAEAKLALNGADAAALLAAGARPAVTGTLTLSGELSGSGLSPMALIGSLHGSGKITLSDAQFAGLNPRAFDAVAHAVDQGLAIDAKRISDVVGKALESGRLAVPHAQGTIAVSAGQARLSKFSADSQDARLSLTGNLDLTDGVLDSRLVLSGLSEQGGVRPDIFMALDGPVTAPRHSIDVSALTGWLTLRAVENQTKQLQKLQQQTPPPKTLPPKPAVEQPSKSEAPLRITPPPAANAMHRAPAVINSAPAPAAKSKGKAAAKFHRPAVLPKSKPASLQKHQRAPALPAPVDIGSLPEPRGVAKPEASANVPHQ